MSKEKDEKYYKALDKRTKEYKEWKSKQKPKGLGDVVENVLEKTGVAQVVKFVMGDDCGCEERKERLNKLWPFRKVQCLVEDEYKFLSIWFSKTRTRITHEEQTQMITIYNRVFNQKTEVSDCGSCVVAKVQELERLYLEYKDKQNG